MKPSPKIVVLSIAASSLMLITVFAKPLGIPSELEMLPMVAGAVCLLALMRATAKAKAAGEIPQMSEAQTKKWLVFAVAVVAVACVAGPFVMPSTGVRLPFHVWVVISIFTFVLSTAAVWLGLRMRTRK